MGTEDYQLGRMAEALERMTETLAEQNERIKALEDRYLTGRGFVVGALITVGFAVYGAKAMVAKLLAAVL